MSSHHVRSTGRVFSSQDLRNMTFIYMLRKSQVSGYRTSV